MKEPKCCSVFDKEVKIFGEGVTIWTLITIILAELMGTAMLVFWLCMGVINELDHLSICLAAGLAITAILQTFAHISKALINPSLAVGACVLGVLNIPMMLVYIVAEIVGAILGYGLLLLVTPASMEKRHCCTVPDQALNLGQSFGVEFLLTFILMMILAGSLDPRNNKHDSLALKFGLAVSALALAGGPYTGAGMNPARSLAPAIFDGIWRDHWVYWVGPLSGGFCAGAFYRLIFGRKASDATEDPSV